MIQKKHYTGWLPAIVLALLMLAITGCSGGGDPTTPVTKTNALGSLSTTTGTTTDTVTVASPAGMTLSIPAGTTFTDISGTPVTGTITTSVSFSTSTADLPAAASTLPTGSTLAAFVDISMGAVKNFSKPISLAINAASSGAKAGDAMVVYIFDSGTNQWTFAGTEIVDANGNITPTVTHLSIWGLFKSIAPPPVKPTGVTAAVDDSSITVSWTTVTGADSYNIYYGTTAGVTPSTGTKVASTTTPQVVGSLANGTTYHFVVTAVNAGGESVMSSEISATPATPVTPPPAIPSAIQATVGDGQASISWTAVTGATSYNLYYGTAAGVTTATGTPITNVTSPKVVTALTNGTTYYFVVTAVNAGGESGVSSEISATPLPPAPAKPAGIIASAGDGQVAVSWTAATGATSYNIYYGTAAGVTAATGTKVANVTSPMVVTGLTNSTSYFFVVTAVNAGGESGVSSEKTATPAAAPQPPGSPNGVVVASSVAGQVSITWNAVPGADSYNVYFLQAGAQPTNAAVLAGIKQSSATTPLTVTGLTSGSKYWFLVTAVNVAGESGTQTNAKNVTVQ